MAQVFRFDMCADMDSSLGGSSVPNNNSITNANKLLANMNYGDAAEDSQSFESSPAIASGFDNGSDLPEDNPSRLNES